MKIDTTIAGWIIAGILVVATIALAVFSRRRYRELDAMQRAADLLKSGLDNKEMDEKFAATLPKDPNA